MQEKFHELIKAVNGDIVERGAEIGTAVNALVSKTHHFQLGPPGVAKSMLVDRMHLYIADINYFHWLLTRFTTPEEIFGPPDLGMMMDDKIYKRNVEGKTPWAHIAFWDEIFKSSSAIINSGLTIMNERKFFNPTEADERPLMTLLAASNELPESEELNAIWDRLHFRHELSKIRQTSAMYEMLTNELDPQPDPIITLEELEIAQAAATQVEVPGDIIEGILDLRGKLAGEGIEPTDRRWRESIGIIKADAWLKGNTKVEVENVTPLIHVLWNHAGEVKKVKEIVYAFSSPYDVEAMAILTDLNLLREKVVELQYQEMEIKAADVASELYGKHEKQSQKLMKLREKIAKSGKHSELLEEALALFKSNVNVLLTHLGIDGEGLSNTIDKAMEDDD